MLSTLSPSHQALLRDIILNVLVENGYHKVLSDPTTGVYEVAKEKKPLVLRLLEENHAISMDAPAEIQGEVRGILRGLAEIMDEYRGRLMLQVEGQQKA